MGSKVIARGRGAGVWRREKENCKSGKVNGLDVISSPGKIMDLVDAHGQEHKEIVSPVVIKPESS